MKNWATGMAKRLGIPVCTIEYFVNSYQPNGTMDDRGVWYPDEDERAACCDAIAPPSRGAPWRLLAHCHGPRHVLSILSAMSVDEARVFVVENIFDPEV